MRILKRAIVVSAFALSFGVGMTAQAALILKLDAGNGNAVTISDGGVGDLDTTAGSVQWMGSLGSWYFNFTAGISNSPALSGPAILNLVSFNATSAARGGTLTISLIETGLTQPFGPNMVATTSVTGSTSGNAQFSSLFNDVSTGTFGSYTGAFNGTSSSAVDTTGGFSLTHVATITHAGGGETAFSMVTSVPEPGTLALFGIGLVVFGWVAGRNNRN